MIFQKVEVLLAPGKVTAVGDTAGAAEGEPGAFKPLAQGFAQAILPGGSENRNNSAKTRAAIGAETGLNPLGEQLSRQPGALAGRAVGDVAEIGDCVQVAQFQAAPGGPQYREPGDAVCRIEQRTGKGKQVDHRHSARQEIDICGLPGDSLLLQLGNDGAEVAAGAGKDGDTAVGIDALGSSNSRNHLLGFHGG